MFGMGGAVNIWDGRGYSKDGHKIEIQGLYYGSCQDPFIRSICFGCTRHVDGSSCGIFGRRARVKILDSRVILKVDIGCYMGITSWAR